MPRELIMNLWVIGVVNDSSYNFSKPYCLVNHFLWSEWSKQIKHLDSHKLILKHNKRTFHYKRPDSFEFINDEAGQ
jgi:hypothetical protein